MYQRKSKIIGGFRAEDIGAERGKIIEYRVEEILTQKGGRFVFFELFKPYLMKNPSDPNQPWARGRGFNLTIGAVQEIVARLNHLVNTYLPPEQRGSFVFHPSVNMSAPVNAQSNWAATPAPEWQNPVSTYPQNPAPPPNYGTSNSTPQTGYQTHYASPGSVNTGVTPPTYKGVSFDDDDIPF